MHTLRAKTLGGFIFPFDGVKIIILFLKVLIIPWGVVHTSCCPGTGTTGNKLFPAGTFEFLETGKKTQINRTRSLKWSFNLKLPPDRTSHHAALPHDAGLVRRKDVRGRITVPAAAGGSKAAVGDAASAGRRGKLCQLTTESRRERIQKEKVARNASR